MFLTNQWTKFKHYDILQGSEGQGGKNALMCGQPYETSMSQTKNYSSIQTDS